MRIDEFMYSYRTVVHTNIKMLVLFLPKQNSGINELHSPKNVLYMLYI
jgi:hypothetical protein